MHTYQIKIKGTVQGVGFRPFIYQLATRYGVCGTVLNGTAGVEIVLNTTEERLHSFLQDMLHELPPLASIETVETLLLAYREFDAFHILSSDEEGEKSVRIPPDVSICVECEKELFDSDNRRYRYPFITCTHCGVRYSIIYTLPYDRQNTSMRFFPMCQVCEAEYHNPLDRRYHAQPIGCWECGPSLSLWDSTQKLNVQKKEVIETASRLLLKGHILAVKGVGGYHLMCDASNETAVKKLRERKQRPSKPFAVMVKDGKMAKALAKISKKEEALLFSKERPVVLLASKESMLASEVAPKLSKVGLFLPYTPLHLLLLDACKRPLVATSANVSNEPLCTTMASLTQLKGVYDYIVEHDREIVNACDDSVVMVVKEETVMLRRARGYAPASVTLPFHLAKRALAMGANQKSTVAIGFDNQVILSPHIGNLETIRSVKYYKKSIKTLERMYAFYPEMIIYDKHPQYESTKYAKERLTSSSLCYGHEVQHHYAHILGVMAEKGFNEKVFGVAFDGTGLGEDGTLWGGEFLLCDYQGYERVGHLDYFKLLGGAKAVKEPRRVALSLLFNLYGEEALALQNPTTQAFTQAEMKTAYLMWQKGLNAPLSSSFGRLFDAVASLLGVCQMMHFEGESGMLLEELYDERIEGSYPFISQNGVLKVELMLEAMLQETNPTIAVSKFFHTIVKMIDEVYQGYAELPLVLSGGVFQNRVLLSLLLERFPHAVIPNAFPPNDGGIALGQMVACLKC